MPGRIFRINLPETSSATIRKLLPRSLQSAVFDEYPTPTDSLQTMMPQANLCLVLHNHQPIGNFDGVFEQAYQDSYLPFLDVFEPYEQLQISLHTSGPLMMWLAERHPEYLDRLRMLVEVGRIEIVGGPQYEPILDDAARGAIASARSRPTAAGWSEIWVRHRRGCGRPNVFGSRH